MSFLELTPPDKPRRFLTTDWTDSEKKFRENHSRFLSIIKSVNFQIPIDNQLCEENSEKSLPVQIPIPSDFSLIVEDKKQEEKREESKESVEYQRTEKPNDGKSVPAEGKTMDIIDELLLGESKPNETSDNIRVEKLGNSDNLIETENTDHPAKNPSALDDLLVSSDDKKVESRPESSVPVASASLPVPPPSNAESDSGPLSSDEFNYEKFAKVKVHISALMLMVNKEIVESYIEKVSGYAMNLSLDEQRVRPEILADTLVKIQANKDTVHRILLETVKYKRWMKEAEDFMKTSGSSCSKAGSDTKRVGDVRLVMPEFFLLLANVEAAYELYELTYKHLCNQADTVSRLVTTQSNEMRYKDIFTGRVEGEKQHQTPFEGPYKRIASSNPDTVPEPPVPERSTEGLDSFTKPNPKKDGPKATGIVDWEF